jgi:hypothetical protein
MPPIFAMSKTKEKKEKGRKGRVECRVSSIEGVCPSPRPSRMSEGHAEASWDAHFSTQVELESVNDLSLNLLVLAPSPPMAITPLLIKILLKRLTSIPDPIVSRPVLIAILEDESNIRLKLRTRRILTGSDLGLDSIEIHRAFHDVEIVRYVVDGWVDGVLEGSDEPRPEAGPLDHAVD